MLMTYYEDHKAEIRYFMMVLGLFFLASVAFSYRDDFLLAIDQADTFLFIVSIFLGLLGNIVAGLMFRGLLSKYGISTTAALALKMHLMGQIIKYVPGKVWGMVYQASHLSEKGGGGAVFVVNLEMMLASIYLTICAAVCLGLYLLEIGYFAVTIWLIVCVFLFERAFRSSLLLSCISLFAKRFEVVRSLAVDKDGLPNIFELIVVCLLFVGLYIASNVLMLSAVFHMSIDTAMTYVVVMSIAWIISIFAFVVPAGMGIKEFLFLLISSFALPEISIGVLTAIAVSSRIWVILQEIMGAVISMFLRRA